MPTYTIDYGGAQDGWANAASALANAFATDYEAEANARLRGAQATNSYAGAYANEQLGRQRGAAAALDERELSVWQEADAMLAEAGITDPQERMLVIGETIGRTGGVDGGNFGDWALGMGGVQGLPQTQMQNLQLGSGMDTANTIEGFDQDQRRQSQQFIMGEAGDTARAREALEFERDFENFDIVRDGQPSIAYRRDVLPTDRPILSETEAKGSIPPPAGGTLPGFPGYEGTGLEQQDMNLILGVADAISQGQPVDPRTQLAYNMAYARMMAPKTEIRAGADGNSYQIVTNPTAPPGLPTPFNLNQVATTGAVPGASPLIPAAPGGLVTPAVPGAAPQGAEVALPGVDRRPALPASPAAPVAPAQAGITATPIPGLPPAPPGAPTEAQARYGQYAERIKGGMIPLMNMMGYDPLSGNFAPGQSWRPTFTGRAVQDFAPDILRPYIQSEEDQVFYTRVAQTLNPLIRADSGAAVPDAEYPRYYAQYVPQAGEPDSVVKAKLDHLLVTQMAFAEVALTPQGRAELQQAELTGNYEGVQAMLHFAKNRIADERGIQIAEFTYPPDGSPPQFVGVRPPGGGTTDLGATGTGTPPVPQTGLPSTITLPGGLEVEVLDWGN